MGWVLVDERGYRKLTPEQAKEHRHESALAWRYEGEINEQTLAEMRKAETELDAD